MTATQTIQPGDTVKLKKGVKHTCPEGRDNKRTAVVRSIYNGDNVMMEDDLRGCLYWNIDDLELVKKGRAINWVPTNSRGSFRGSFGDQVFRVSPFTRKSHVGYTAVFPGGSSSHDTVDQAKDACEAAL